MNKIKFETLFVWKFFSYLSRKHDFGVSLIRH